MPKSKIDMGWVRRWIAVRRQKQRRKSRTAEPMPPLPTGPQFLAATYLGGGLVELNWDLTGVAFADGMSLERKFEWEDESAFTVIATTGPAVVVYDDTVSQGLTFVNYRIRAFNAAGYSGYSDWVTVSIPPL
jgi:hypothetical protein